MDDEKRVENKTVETDEVTKSPQKKYVFRNILSTALIIAGIVIIAIPLIGRYRADREQERMLEEVYRQIEAAQTEAVASEEVVGDLNAALDFGTEDANQEVIDEGAALGETYDPNDHSSDRFEISFDDSSESETSAEDIYILKTLGVIKIDKIDLEYPIGEGTDANALRYSIGHLTGSAEVNELGNNVMAGHRSHSYGTYFHRLDEVEVGDTIEIIDMTGTEVTYIVYETKIVDESDLSVMRGSKDYRVITLITCDPLYQPNPTNRLIVHAIDVTQMEALDQYYNQD